MLDIKDCVAGTRVRMPAHEELDCEEDTGVIVEHLGRVFINHHNRSVWVKWDSNGEILNIGYRYLEKI